LYLRVTIFYISFIICDVTNDSKAVIPVNVICSLQTFHVQWRLSADSRWACSLQRSLAALGILVNNPNVNYCTRSIYLHVTLMITRVNKCCSNWQISPLRVDTCKIWHATTQMWFYKYINSGFKCSNRIKVFVNIDNSEHGYLVWYWEWNNRYHFESGHLKCGGETSGVLLLSSGELKEVNTSS
jgi:hypothetical protein